ncbi:dephospho-CoA kinase [Arthrobacter sp. zg-Y820]|uniref:dephospho-CoA kinase n=1 Tax=unclassified Arthrobacter TaxID=235627 RepID=UPI001E2AD74C|nr:MULTISPECIES: dephospho-CoA kinase [unclassified Arthrobacter]MCC9196588.1 dephospho-CoA kinase [Arthrobacter sp. zg-Y820]MDK1279450.1 dephospho-CoA kinase [Arthrobacter sp. zg.Y820]WIB08171.1 dephospho-CoA kinase [Arthrobacter sp. zg-Y820]
MLRVGLTGGIAAGKSLAARTLQDLGALVIDSDALAREVVEPGTEGLTAVVDAFGPGMLDGEGRLDRPALAAVVFSDADKREILNGIVHPRVRARAAELERQAAPETIVVHDIPLLVETGQHRSFDFVLVIDAPEQERIRRMAADRGMSEEAARARIAAQAGAAERAAAADVVLVNAGRAGELVGAVRELWRSRLVPLNEALLRTGK